MLTLLQASNADNTWNTYQSGVASFQQFLSLQGSSLSMQISHNQLINYIAYMFEEGYSYSTVKSYLSGIGFFLKLHDQEDTTQKFLVKKALNGFARLDFRKDDRQPITRDILLKIVKALPNICHSNYEVKMFQASFSLAFFGFLRAGEFTSTHYNSNRIMLRSHLSLDKDTATVIVPFSKTDQLGQSSKLFISKQEHQEICPIRLLSDYVSLRPMYNGPLFCHLNSSPLSYYQFSSILKQSLNFAGLDASLYNTHSFRIGAATQSYMDGLSNEVLQVRGRWSSKCYRNYIRPKST